MCTAARTEDVVASLGRRVALTGRKEDPQARLLHTMHVGISVTPHPSRKRSGMAIGPYGLDGVCAENVHAACTLQRSPWWPAVSLLEQILRARSPKPAPRGERMTETTRKLNVVFNQPGHYDGRCTVHSRREKDTEGVCARKGLEEAGGGAQSLTYVAIGKGGVLWR